MIIDVKELLKAVGEKADLDFSEVASFAEDGLTLTSPVSVRARLVNSGQGILVTGKISAEAELVCCRCLKPFRQTLVAELHERYIQPGPARDEAEELELQDSDFVSPMDNDTEINLAEVVRQNLLMVVPMKPLCRTGCTGLPESAHFHSELPGDPRWGQLKRMLESDESE